MRSVLIGLALALAASAAMACDYARPTASNENSTPVPQQTAAVEENATPIPEAPAEADSAS